MATAQLHPLIRYVRQISEPEEVRESTDGQLLGRFVRDGHEQAFAALVVRHGPMVLGLCRRVLGDGHEAEDAFQATFFLLARKARLLSQPERLSSWLHGVATRTAARARQQAARRRCREAQVTPSPATGPDDGLLWRDLRPVLDEEIERLPPRYRVPVVLCYLEGRTNDEAARHMGCSRGTVATRLARARERLRRQFVRRGLAPGAAVSAACLAQTAQAAGVPELLLRSTARAVCLFAAGGFRATEVLSAEVAGLVKGILVDMVFQKAKWAAIFLLLTGALAAGAAGLSFHSAWGADERPSPRPASGGLAAPVAAEAAGEKEPEGEASVYRTANFEVTAPGKGVAQKVARAAEARRKSLAREWLGEEMPRWERRCPIQVKVQEGATDSYTSFQFEGGKVVDQQMCLQGPLNSVLVDLLPHEVTHTVLAHRFGRGLPRWADEGAALLAESAGSRKSRQRMLSKILDDERRIPLALLLPMREYPRDVMALYTQGASLTEFLVRKGGREQFLTFVERSDRQGWKKAVKTIYGYSSIEMLEKAWLETVAKTGKEAGQAAGDERRPSVAARRESGRPSAPADPRRVGTLPQGRLPTGPAPTQGLAKLEKDGNLTVWRVQSAYKLEYAVRTDGRPTSQAYYAPVRSIREDKYRLREVKVYDLKGNRVSEEAVANALRGEVPVLIAQDGGPIDPLHLRLIKAGTLTFVLPPSTPQQPPPNMAPLAPPERK